MSAHPVTLTCDCDDCMRDPDPAPMEWALTDWSKPSSHPVDNEVVVYGDVVDVTRQSVFSREEVVERRIQRRVGNLAWETVTEETVTVIWAFVQ